MKFRGGKIGSAIGVFALLLPLAASAFTPNDPLLSEQWYLGKVGAFQAWDTTRGDSSVIVAVIDSGVDIDHPDLAANIWKNPKEIDGDAIDNDGNGFVDDVHGWDFLTDTPDPRPKADPGQGISFAHHHGTAVAGIIAAVADNGRGISGIAPNVKIMPLRTLDSTGKGNSSTVIKAINYAVDNGASIINLSFVSTLRDPPGSTGNNAPFFRAIEHARQKGVLVVAAAGNESSADTSQVVDLDVNPQVPVCEDPGNPFQAVIGVAATDREDHRAVFSSFGRRCIDLSAPGDDFFVLTASREPVAGVTQESYSGYYRGTSLAAPVVSGAAALLKSLNPKLTADDLQTVLEQTADPIEVGSIYDGRVGKGRVNIAKAVERVRSTMANVPLAQSVALVSAPRAITQTDGQLQPTVAAKTKVVESILLALNEKDSARLVRVREGATGGFEEIARLPGNITSIAELASGQIAATHTRATSPTEIILFTSDGIPVKSWLPFGPTFRRTVTLGVGDVDGDRADDIVVGAGPGGTPDVAVFTAEGKRKVEFLAYAKTFRGGVDLAVGNVFGNAADKIVTAPLSGGSAQIRVFDGQGKLNVQFFAGNTRDRAGASVALINRGEAETSDIAVSALNKKRGELKVFGSDGKLKTSLLAFDVIDRAFTAHRDRNSLIMTVAAQHQPSIVGVLTGAGDRVRIIKLPKNIDSVALGTTHYTIALPGAQ